MNYNIKEEWRDVKEFEGYYQISNLGRVKSFMVCNSHQKVPRILKPSKDRKGYLGYHIGGKRKKAHRLVADAYIPNVFDKPQVNHIDGNKSNNRVDNLEWCTNSENQIHSNKMGLRKIKKGSEVYNARAVKQFDIYGNLINVWGSGADVERILKINQSSVSSCCLGKYGYKTAGGYVWKYESEVVKK